MTIPAEQIQAALAKLGLNNDNHWTADGLPRLDTVKMLAGDQSLTRDAVTAASPGFTRASAAQGVQTAPPAAPPPAAQETPVAPPAAATAQETPPEQPSAPPEVPPAPPEVPPAPPPAPAATGLPPAGTAELPSRSNPNPRANIPVVDNTEELEKLKAERQAVSDELEDLQRSEAALKKHKLKMQEKFDDLNIRITKLEPVSSNQLDIRAYLDSQNKQLQRRAEQIGNVRKVEAELGVRLQDIVPKRSPIDAAMARKTGYGKTRPGG